MGTFFKALEQAERERALTEQARRRAASSTTAPSTREPSRDGPMLGQTAEVAKPVVDPLVSQRPVDRELSRKSEPPRESPVAPAARVEEHLVSLLTPMSREAEQYRALRLRVEELHRETNHTVVGVTSPQARDGKTLTTINLAGALAQAPGARVLIVDLDLRRSTVPERLGLEGSRGPGVVGAILDHDLVLQDVVEPCPPFNLSVVRAGRQPSAPYELLKSPRLGQLLDEARKQYDYVIVDMPPLVPLPDCGVIGRSVDRFLIVVTAHKTPRQLVEEALKVLDPAAVLGLIFNGDDRPLDSYYGYYYGERAEAAARSGWWAGSRRGRRTAREGTE